MGRKKRSGQNNNNNHPEAAKKVKQETGESFLVKKYRPAKQYAAMDAFVKYTKSHRMLDASYVRWKTGVTPEKLFVFSTRVGGVDLGWGRGKTREAAMDCACRAAFALVSAHGYNNFPLDDDCLMQAPVEAPPPPPPPPPLPPAPQIGIPQGLPPAMYPGTVPPPGVLPPPPPPPPPPVGNMPPLPLGLPPNNPPLPRADLIPQPQAVSTEAPTASSLSTVTPTVSSMPTAVPPGHIPDQPPHASVSLSIGQPPEPTSAPAKRKLKGGFTLAYDPEGEGVDEISMEEKRALLPRYLKSLRMATGKVNA